MSPALEASAIIHILNKLVLMATLMLSAMIGQGMPAKREPLRPNFQHDWQHHHRHCWFAASNSMASSPGQTASPRHLLCFIRDQSFLAAVELDSRGNKYSFEHVFLIHQSPGARRIEEVLSRGTAVSKRILSRSSFVRADPQTFASRLPGARWIRRV